MALGFGVVGAQTALDALRTAYTWVQLHTVGEPGAAGTANVAIETDRQQASFGATDGAGAFTTTGALTWTNVAGSEDYLYFTVWSASTVGNFGWSGSVTANAVTAGDTFTIATGDLDTSVSLAS